MALAAAPHAGGHHRRAPRPPTRGRRTRGPLAGLGNLQLGDSFRGGFRIPTTVRPWSNSDRRNSDHRPWTEFRQASPTMEGIPTVHGRNSLRPRIAWTELFRPWTEVFRPWTGSFRPWSESVSMVGIIPTMVGINSVHGRIFWTDGRTPILGWE